MEDSNNKKQIYVSYDLIKEEDKDKYQGVYLDVNADIFDGEYLDIEKFKKYLNDNPGLKSLYGDIIEFITPHNNKLKLQWKSEKMSKSKMNVINPDDVIEQYGADTFRLYIMFLGPLGQDKVFDKKGIIGIYNFLKKFLKLYYLNDKIHLSDELPTKQELKLLHSTTKQIKQNIEKFSFNTCVSALMKLVNELTNLKCNKKEILEPLIIMLSPFAPYTAEYLWTELGHETSVVDVPYPEYKEEYIVENTFNYPIAFNGKTRLNIELPLNITKEQVEQLVLSNSKVKEYIKDKQVKKIIFVEKKIINILI